MTLTMLRKVLALDAASCALFFGACVLFTSTAARIVGLPEGVVAAAGWICLAAGLLFTGLALSPRPSPRLIAFGALGNALWVAASVAVVALFAGQMTGAGVVLVLGQAAAVAALTWLEAKGAGSVRRMLAAA